jgi:hypothetical protein
MSACAVHLIGEGICSLLVWVLRDNPYRVFYEALGGSQVREKQVQIGEVYLPEVAYGWKDMRQVLRFIPG